MLPNFVLIVRHDDKFGRFETFTAVLKATSVYKSF